MLKNPISAIIIVISRNVGWWEIILTKAIIPIELVTSKSIAITLSAMLGPFKNRKKIRMTETTNMGNNIYVK